MPRTRNEAARDIFQHWNAWTILLFSTFVLLLYVSAARLFATGLALAHRSSSEIAGGSKFSPLSFAVIDSPQTSVPSPQKVERTKVAEGQYQVFQTKSSGALGPFRAEVYNFRESWTLWRLGAGGYQVDGLREFDSPLGESHSNRFQALLSTDLRVRSVKEFAKLRWRPDSGPLTCEFEDRELRCSSNAQDAQQAIELKIAMQHPFGFLWPISPFSLSGIARSSGKHLRQTTPVQLVEIDEASTNTPVSPLVLTGRLRYLGQEKIRVAKRTWRADKFQLDVPLHSSYQMWTSSEGILLSLFEGLGKNNEPARKIDLVRYEKFSGF
ncbi:MAG: hypothetical protein GZ088_06335 [Acidipila sp.]|nr:hypothetical protein [Acidipila sp.]